MKKCIVSIEGLEVLGSMDTDGVKGCTVVFQSPLLQSFCGADVFGFELSYEQFLKLKEGVSRAEAWYKEFEEKIKVQLQGAQGENK